MSRSALAIVLLAGLAAVWAWGSPALRMPWPPPPSPLPAAPAATPVPAVRLPQLSAPGPGHGLPEGGRNPFLAAVAAAREASTAASPRAVVPVGPAAPIAPAWPRLELIGVAEFREGDALMRTAVIAGPRGVLHARPGDVLEEVYRLERLGPTGADLRLLPEDRVVHLALRP